VEVCTGVVELLVAEQLGEEQLGEEQLGLWMLRQPD